VKSTKLVVGDLIYVKQGDKVPADALFVEGHGLTVDNSSQTGESRAVAISHEFPFLLSGAFVQTGTCFALVCAVGVQTQSGATFFLLQQAGSEETPLQTKLKRVTVGMTYVGVVFAVIIASIFGIQIGIRSRGGWNDALANEVIDDFMVVLTVFINAVPDGLPLAVTLSLALSMGAMVKDNNLVRHLAACETMGEATTMCTDKTGTLTQNSMKVVRTWVGFGEAIPELIRELLFEAVALNTIARRIENDGVVRLAGMPTEIALLDFMESLGGDFERIRELHETVALHDFTSDRKRSSVVARCGDGLRGFVKGAPDYLLPRCIAYTTAAGITAPLTEELRSAILDEVGNFASRALRTLLIATREIDEHTDLTDADAVECNLVILAIVGIADPLRPEVPEAVAACARAGVVVRMCTGDHIETASAIALEAGILTDGGICMTGAQFAASSPAELVPILPRIQVLARSSPFDKLRFVQLLQSTGETVAASGDGVNDVPALRTADIGLGMGSGSELAKLASDIVILDDNFTSMVTALKWGRCIYDNVRSFLVYQLVVNFATTYIICVAALFTGKTALYPIQVLWLSMINGPLGAVAFSTSRPVESLLLRKPYGAADAILNNVMMRETILNTILQCIVLSLLLFQFETFFGDGGDAKRQTVLCNTFVFMAIFNLINCRSTCHHQSPYEGLAHHRVFWFVLVGSAALQFVFSQFGGLVMLTEPLSGVEWLLCISFALTVLVGGFAIRRFPLKDNSSKALERLRLERTAGILSEMELQNLGIGQELTADHFEP
jgi:Ca2+-transporting ATPase